MNVHRALSCHCRQQVCISTLVISRGLHQRLVGKSGRIRKNQIQNSSVLPTDACLNSSIYKHNLVCHRRAYVALKVLAQWCGQSVFTNFALHLAIALHLALALLVAIAVMIRSSQEVLKLVHRSLVSHNLHIRFNVHDQR